MEFNRNHYGNAFAYISRKQSRNGSIYTDGLYPLNPEYTTILIDNIGLLGTKDAVYIRYIEPKSSRIYLYDYEDVLHYRSSIISYDGFSGMAIRDVLHSTLQEKKAAQSITRGIYESGVTGKAVLEYVGELDDNAEAKLLNHIKKYSSGADNYGNIVPIPLGMRLTPLNISLSDVQFLDIKKFTSLEIAAAFGIKPNQLNDYEKSSYSNSEAQNLSFYVDTLLYILNGCEQEDSYKLLSTSERNNGYFIKRNVKGILRADYKSQMESLRVGVTTGIMQINEARNELDLPMVEGGDINIVNGTYIGINDVGKQYKEKGE
jgi:phage portal protein, HK97 family